MLRPLPSLDWLRVFAAAATTESFAAAAQQLRVTPSAISQRIKALEAYLGVPLFRRHAQGVVLTDAGRRFAARVHDPLDQLARATQDAATARTSATLRVTVLPALAQLWLGPRLANFHRLNTGAVVEIWADATVVDLPRSSFDVAIRYGTPPFPGCAHRLLLEDALVPVASPALVAASQRDGSGLPINSTLMLDTYWPTDLDDWLAETGHARPPGLRTQTFSLYSMAVEAVLDGQGFMIGHTSLVSDLVAQGRLQPLSDHHVSAQKQFHVLTKGGEPPAENTAAFVDWLLKAATDAD